MGGHIVWMRGVELEPEPGIKVVATDLHVCRTIDGATGSRYDTFE
jgi:hypothetical protein